MAKGPAVDRLFALVTMKLEDAAETAVDGQNRALEVKDQRRLLARLRRALRRCQSLADRNEVRLNRTANC
jgi:hypothetical protein